MKGRGRRLTRLDRKAYVQKAQHSGSQPVGPTTRSRSQAVACPTGSLPAAQHQQQQQLASTRKRSRAAEADDDVVPSSPSVAAGANDCQPQDALAAECLEHQQLLQHLQQLRLQHQQTYTGPACRTRKRACLQAQREQQQVDQIGISMEQLVAEILTRTNDEALPYQVPELLAALGVLPAGHPARVHIMVALFNISCRSCKHLLRMVAGLHHTLVHILQAMMSSDAVLSTPAALTLAHMVKAITEPFQADIAASFLQALQPHLAQLLLLVHNSNSGVSTAATSACLGLMMASIKIGPAAMAAILDALMANDRKGLKNLMLGLADSTGCKLAGSLSAIGMATVSFLAGAVQALAGLPASFVAADALVDTLLGEDQQVLHHIMQFPKLTLNITFIVRVTAQAAPARLLQALLKRKERRSLHFLISLLGGNDNGMVADTVNAVTRMAQVADLKQLRVLLRLLLPAMQAGNVGCAHCVAFMAQLPLAVPELLHNVRQFQKLMLQRGHRCDVLATSVLWHLAHHPMGLQALSTQRRLDSFVQVLEQNDREVAQAAASIIYLSSQTPKGNDILWQHLSALLRAARAPQGSIASSAMASVAMIASRSLGGAQQVLQYTDQVLDVMLQPLTADFAASPGNAAQQAGFTLFYIWQCPKGPEVLSADSNLDKLLQVVQQQGPAMPDAANALRQLLAAVPPDRCVEVTPARAAMLDSVQGILEEALSADPEHLSGDKGYQCLAPVYYMTMVAGSFGYCPSYLRHLVRVMQCSEVTVPVLEILTHVTSGPAGLLAVAPHMQQVLAATTAGLLAEDPFLQEYVQTLVRRIKAEVEQLRQQQQAAQQAMHRAGVCLTQQWQHLRRRVRSRKQQLLVQLLLRQLSAAADRHGKLLLQLRSADVGLGQQS